MSKDPYRYFRVEARELLEQMSQGTLDLERESAPAAVVQKLLRLAHTLKGAARVVRQVDIANHAHGIEDLLAPWRDAVDPVQRQCIDALLARLDEIAALVALLGPAGDAKAPAASPVNAAAVAEAPRTFRAELADMETLADGVAETYGQLAGLKRRAESLNQANALAMRLRARLAPQASGAKSSAVNRQTLALADELQALLARSAKGLGSSTERMDRELRQVRDAAEQLRLVGAASLFPVLERSARDAAQLLGKQVVFEARGGEVRLDSTMLGGIQDALLQLVRNAVAHGIEASGDRRAAGKPVQGRVVIEVLRRGRRVVFVCTDDGAGVDLEAVRRSALRQGLIDPVAPAPDAAQLMSLLLRGGISTSSSVTQVAGRGVGLDVVRDTARRLGGEVSAHSTPGHGVSIELAVPLSLASLEALLVEAGSTIGAIPLDAVRRVLRLTPAQIGRSGEGQSIVHGGRAIPFVTLAQVMGEPPPTTPRNTTAVIVDSAGTLAAVGVDRLVSTSTLVLRPLPELTPACPLVAGASMDVEGNPRLLFDPEGLVRQAQCGGLPAPAPQAARVPVLVIDDSLTTRMLEQSILESAGYEVHLAVSAEDGLEQARARPYALFLVDVEMPGMDGFSFIERTQAEPALRGVPAVLVTSRSSPEDLRRGQDVGARGYIVKSEFAQAEFLERVRQLVAQS